MRELQFHRSEHARVINRLLDVTTETAANITKLEGMINDIASTKQVERDFAAYLADPEDMLRASRAGALADQADSVLSPARRPRLSPPLARPAALGVKRRMPQRGDAVGAAHPHCCGMRAL